MFDYIPFPVFTHTHTHNGDDTLPGFPDNGGTCPPNYTASYSKRMGSSSYLSRVHGSRDWYREFTMESGV